jgi:hypothetical protein
MPLSRNHRHRRNDPDAIEDVEGHASIRRQSEETEQAETVTGHEDTTRSDDDGTDDVEGHTFTRHHRR